MSTLNAHEVNVSLNGHSILEAASFSVKRGELVGLIGPNGAGKTTLLRALVGLIPIQKGRITFNSLEIKKGHQFLHSKKIAYLEQSRINHWPLTVENLVMLGRIPHLGQWRRPSQKDRNIAYQAMKKCDVAQFMSRQINTLSGGEQARVMLARALATEPEILLADEPVAGLDPSHQLNVMDKLRGLIQERAGVVVVMHDLTLAARYCDRLTLLFEGMICADGPAEYVLSPELLKRCYGIEAQIGKSTEGMYVIPRNRVM